ncbi:hypothetical protein [Caldibacillus thermoamylovorans]|uniref:hypothetical protein n=1 Tax=Caldibacillus thermoamylovorans TaxID=35841 RepID=UPI002041F925|nr:hypothetical protein [Caldibacillus thermoamylovorans]MCM3478596.1 hypothetical protein [Caldibacillus thermoamylovorans]
MVTRFGLVTKTEHFSLQNGDENRVSSSKISVSHLKLVTRFRLVAKTEHFSIQNGDEIGLRRQKTLFSTPNWRRD